MISLMRHARVEWEVLVLSFGRKTFFFVEISRMNKNFKFQHLFDL